MTSLWVLDNWLDNKSKKAHIGAVTTYTKCLHYLGYTCVIVSLRGILTAELLPVVSLSASVGLVVESTQSSIVLPVVSVQANIQLSS